MPVVLHNPPVREVVVPGDREAKQQVAGEDVWAFVAAQALRSGSQHL